ncbi:hypothetical protein DCAR_0314396 [Daucus carota subsp. sativus]|uniref:Uncharacterized protein n=1 Tax=Daucus carota subsp. sativus TaxID=79200 RepID=A0A166CIN6_DAUCS|nr:hypothetical protein DCAR_0314396 [Daucus carota subsp. sativus]
MYLIEPSLKEEQEIDSDGFAVDSISPIKTIKRSDQCFITQCGMFRLGSRFYFLGGRAETSLYYVYSNTTPVSDELKLRVQVFDIDYPELGLRNVASLKAPKETPCVFSVKGLVYVLGSHLRGCNLTGGTSGIFERYDPFEDCWEVLPDPPKPFGEAGDATWCDSATVVRDKYVYVGNNNHDLYLVFDLDVQRWTSFPPSSPFSTRFRYGSLYVDGSLYYLTGIGTWKVGTEFDTKIIDYNAEDNEVRLVKTRPPPSVDDPFKLLKSISLKPENEQVMCTFMDLEHNTWFSGLDFGQWRDIFHLGGRFFCYVVTCQLIDVDNKKLDQPYCRGVWIKVFEEMVPDRNSATKQPHFRNLASFSYRIRTPFENSTSFIRCSAFGSVPDSWVKAPLKKKEVAAKDRGDLKTEQSHEHGGGIEGLTHDDLQKILAAREEEICRLKSELAMKAVLLKDYESFLAKSKGQSALVDW